MFNNSFKGNDNEVEPSQEYNGCCKGCSCRVKGCPNIITEYASNSSIHGFRYFSELNRPLSERIWWLIAFFLSLCGCIHFIMTIWNKWEQTPVILSFADNLTPLWQIPFPAITICPQIKTMPSFFNYTDGYNTIQFNNTENKTTEYLDRMDSLLHICDMYIEGSDKKYTDGKKCVENLLNGAPNLNEIMDSCKVPQSNSEKCDKYFTEIITDAGICYTFNMINSNEMFNVNEIQNDYIYYNHSNESTHWTLERGYDNESPFNTYPIRVFTTNAKDSMVINLISNENDYDYLCGGSIPGFKILFHSPNDYPRFSKKFHRILLDDQVFVSVIPSVTTTSKGLINYPPNKRQCIYNKDRKLKFFKVYSRKNCELECLANYTLQKCGCVKFSMPNSQGTRICGTELINCYRTAAQNLAAIQQKQLLSGKVNKQTECNCLTSCFSLEYNSELISYDLNRQSMLRAMKSNLSETKPGLKRSVVTISFKNMDFITNKRSELYGPTDFVANCGGLLGLFMGVSLLSFVEIIYFFTIRLFSNLMNTKKLKKHNQVQPSPTF